MKKVKEKGGDFSLRSALELAKAALCEIPPYGSREVLVIMSSLTSCDEGDILQTISALKSHNITTSVIQLAAELHICSYLAQSTGGQMNVVLNKEHYRDLLSSYIIPLPASMDKVKVQRTWIRMGFPQQKSQTYPALCNCHEELKYVSFSCPKCAGRFCELPTKCRVCNLTLVSSPHLARAYHHLFPVPLFHTIQHHTDSSKKSTSTPSNATTSDVLEEEDEKHGLWKDQCFSCRRVLLSGEDLRMSCPECKQTFCIDCDELIHSQLHNCPGCLSIVPDEVPPT